ncbi:MAG: hypothetical protein JXA16_11150 [Bacteroidales bacterium]|nr:hypothetical protein [Bacteroidales bacterium]
MANIDFKDVFDKLKENAINLALETGKKYAKNAKGDALKFLDKTKDKLEKWTIMLAEGKLTKKEYEDLILGQKELMEMHALKQAGLSIIAISELRDSLLKMVISTVIGFL